MPKRSKSAGAVSQSNWRALPLLILLFVAGVAGGVWYANRQTPPPIMSPGQVRITKPVAGDNDVRNQQTDTIPVDPKKGDPIRQALEAQLAPPKTGEVSAFPAGTRLVNLDVRDGTAILELSPEFKAINKSGDTGESLAYDALRKVLAQFPNVERMRVLVDGKVFEGEHSGEWAEVQVRDNHARVESKL